MKRAIICAILTLMVIAIPTSAASWNTPSPTPFPVPEWQKSLLTQQIAAQVDSALGGNGIKYVPPTSDDSFVITGNGYFAKISLEYQAAGANAWQGNFVKITGLAQRGNHAYYIFGLKGPNQPVSVQISQVGGSDAAGWMIGF